MLSRNSPAGQEGLGPEQCSAPVSIIRSAWVPNGNLLSQTFSQAVGRKPIGDRRVMSDNLGQQDGLEIEAESQDLRKRRSVQA